MRTRHVFGLTAAGLLAVAAVGGCDRQPHPAALTVEIRDEFNRQQLPQTITVAVAEDGVANLGGTVRSPEMREKAEDVAEDVAGVKHVNNNIRVATAAGDAPAGPPKVAPQYSLPESGVPPAGAGNEPAARPGMDDAGPHPR